jgi:flagellar motility protein MotE (MotC chaperone)
MMPRIRLPRVLPITIFALAGLLSVKSAELVRFATASTEQSKTVATAGQAATASSERPPPALVAPAADDNAAPVPDGERAVLLELRQRREELDGRETTLAARESLIAAAELKLAGRVADLQTLQKKLESLEATRLAREDASWQGLVKVYEVMKPRDAATIFNELDMPVLLQVVDRMKEAKTAPVLAAMLPDKARDVTAQLAKLRSRGDGSANPMVGG